MISSYEGRCWSYLLRWICTFWLGSPFKGRCQSWFHVWMVGWFSKSLLFDATPMMELCEGINSDYWHLGYGHLRNSFHGGEYLWILVETKDYRHPTDHCREGDIGSSLCMEILEEGGHVCPTNKVLEALRGWIFLRLDIFLFFLWVGGPLAPVYRLGSNWVKRDLDEMMERPPYLRGCSGGGEVFHSPLSTLVAIDTIEDIGVSICGYGLKSWSIDGASPRWDSRFDGWVLVLFFYCICFTHGFIYITYY
jgi:hypothetical protein